MQALAGERGMFTAVGDDDQSIYAWRGANPENLGELSRDYPQLKVIKLEQNYRCGRRILRVANALIANNDHLFEKKLWSEGAEGAPIRVLECRDDEHEAERVAAEIAHLAEKHKARWNEFAILYRGNHQSRPLEKALRIARVPYHLTGGTAFLDRAEVKDLLAYLRLINNPDDDAAFLRIVNMPRRDIGATSLEKLGQLAGARHVSMLRAAQHDAVLGELSARPASALAGFVGLVRELAAQRRTRDRGRSGRPADRAHRLRRPHRRADQGTRPACAPTRESQGTRRLVPHHAEGRRGRRPRRATGPARPTAIATIPAMPCA